MVRSLAGNLIGSIVQETAAPIRFVDSGHEIDVSTDTLRLSVEKHLFHEASCGNKHWSARSPRSTAPRWGRPPTTSSAARRSAPNGTTRTTLLVLRYVFLTDDLPHTLALRLIRRTPLVTLIMAFLEVLTTRV